MSVGFEFIKREIILGGPDLISCKPLKEGLGCSQRKSPAGLEEANSHAVNYLETGPSRSRGPQCYSDEAVNSAST